MNEEQVVCETCGQSPCRDIAGEWIVERRHVDYSLFVYEILPSDSQRYPQGSIMPHEKWCAERRVRRDSQIGASGTYGLTACEAVRAATDHYGGVAHAPLHGMPWSRPRETKR